MLEVLVNRLFKLAQEKSVVRCDRLVKKMKLRTFSTFSFNLLTIGTILPWCACCQNLILVQALISVQALVFDLAQLTCKKRFDCENAILRYSAILLGTSYRQIVVAVLM